MLYRGSLPPFPHPRPARPAFRWRWCLAVGVALGALGSGVAWMQPRVRLGQQVDAGPGQFVTSYHFALELTHPAIWRGWALERQEFPPESHRPPRYQLLRLPRPEFSRFIAQR